jgi:membrane protease YdiL (CAAX protease family)
MTDSITDPDTPFDRASLRPAVWPDLTLYLFGGVGLFFLVGLLIGSLFSEPGLWVTVLIAGANFLVLTGSVWAFGVLRRKVSWRSFGLVPLPDDLWRTALIGTALAIGILPFRMLAGGLALGIEYLVNGEITSLAMREGLFSVGFDTWYGALLLIIGIGVLAPIAEELFFRGLLYDFFRQKTGVRGAILISSTLFGLAHFDSLAVVLSSFVMGLAMAYAVERTHSLWISIFMHVATNAGALLLLVVISRLQNLLEIPFI